MTDGWYNEFLMQKELMSSLEQDASVQPTRRGARSVDLEAWNSFHPLCILLFRRFQEESPWHEREELKAYQHRILETILRHAQPPPYANEPTVALATAESPLGHHASPTVIHDASPPTKMKQRSAIPSPDPRVSRR